MKNAYMIAVDWGTTHFRAYCIDNRGNVLDQHQDEFGASRLNQNQFEQHLSQQTHKWQTQTLPIIIAGMAGSTIGWHNVAYVDCPSNLKDIAQSCFKVNRNQPTWIVPGLKYTASDNQADVMRGEETQLLGWLNDTHTTEKELVVLPGTHSKWACVSNKSIDHFATAMTGELYQLLSEHSLLKFTEKQIEDKTSFMLGLQESKTSRLLQQLFSIRAQTVLGKLPQKHQSSYLSGLLIGTEIKQMLPVFEPAETVTLIGNNALIQHYKSAFDFYNIQSTATPGDKAVISGLLAINKQLH